MAKLSLSTMEFLGLGNLNFYHFYYLNFYIPLYYDDSTISRVNIMFFSNKKSSLDFATPSLSSSVTLCPLLWAVTFSSLLLVSDQATKISFSALTPPCTTASLIAVVHCNILPWSRALPSILFDNILKKPISFGNSLYKHAYSFLVYTHIFLLLVSSVMV